MKVGHLNYLEADETKGRPDAVYMGEVNTFGLVGDLVLVPRVQHKENSPAWTVKMRTAPGYPWHEAGSAWNKSMKNGGLYLSLAITIPNRATYNVQAFPAFDQPEEGPPVMDLVYSPPRRQGTAPQAAAGGQVADEIPY